ncbi:PREDICTED: G-type lectin S-receptor-like serine/threonine-protein kinase LECRK3 [Nelumbo nucifera]|uniref:G-type lectin S-receptor-like serine/threonine-protein kinase LECRK3 n=1 Tax=Nelumbo nucifera TaxID=4432 RepID=A0A1U8Q6H7_NELNU|nr:PREDICTED: G-type lectin S-receptor-like serine/threonine-protein kinase LECRK3 [Nelumbo nucifera]
MNAICGVYGICSSPDNETVSCDCLPGYRPLDPNNIANGCYPKVKSDRCIEKPSLTNFTVEVIDDADFPNAGFADLGRVTPTDEEGCKKALMDDCYCMVASFVNSTCYKKRMPVLNARIIRNSTNGYKALIKVPKYISDGGGILDGDHGRKKSVSRGLLKTGLFTSAAFALLFAALAVYYHPVVGRLIRRSRRLSADVDAMLINLRAFTFKELHEATCGFTTRLGRGSFGMVYSGTLIIEDKQIEIAVKALEKIAAAEQGEKEFEAELTTIG